MYTNEAYGGQYGAAMTSTVASAERMNGLVVLAFLVCGERQGAAGATLWRAIKRVYIYIYIHIYYVYYFKLRIHIRQSK